MSDRKNVIIEADDITIMQGEMVKDYNVRVTKEDGSPINNFPLTIAFYNKDYTFSKDVRTNMYGVASVPLYLNGDSWKVDVHFKGNNLYSPNLVTKNITVQKFQRKLTYIESKNLHLNEDDVIATDDGWYTVYLYDEDDMPVQFEPITFTMISSSDDVDDVNFILRTDEDGKIVVPYLTHNDTIVVTVEYKGCTRYSPSTKVDMLSFDDIGDRADVEFISGYFGQVLLKLGDDPHLYDIYTSGLVEGCIINKENDDRTSYDELFFYTSLNEGTYQVTAFYKGNETYFSKVQTVMLNVGSDRRKYMEQWIFEQGERYGYYVGLNPYPLEMGSMTTINITFYCKIPYLKYKVSINDEDEQTVVPTYFNMDNGRIYSVLYCTTLCPKSSNVNISVYCDDSDIIKESDFVDITANATTTSRDDPTLSQTGFGRLNNAYQNMEINCQNNLSISYDKINDFYYIRLININTFEVFYFYSYLIDNVTPSHLEFVLGLGEWEMYLVSKESENYNGGYYTTSAIITNEDVYENIDDFFFNIDNWNEYGLEEITIENETISAPQTNDLIAITDEFTDSNTYTLYWNATFGTYSNGSMLIGADETGSTMLAIRKSNITLIKNGIVIDEKTITDNISGNWKLVRNGNTWELYHMGELLYSTDELIYNTFGLMGGSTTITGLFVENTPSADITPSVNDYDGSVYGSDLHLEVRKDHINLYDYGMLPSGAVGSAKVIVDEVPVQAEELELRLKIDYNNTRFQRLENLTGEMQIRTYEDISTTDTATQYSQVLCSPMPVRDVETVFTRHSEEGTLYYIKDPRISQNTGISPSYLCNAYTQYKGGVEIKSETGISLFSLDNAYSPVYVGNNLIRAEFHRRSGYIKISRWDENSSSWFTANVLKLKGTPQLKLLDGYNDDYAGVQFGDTTWKFYRGRPFIVVNHPNDDIRILNLVDRVYCEIMENQRSMGFLEEKDAICGVFNPQVSVQQFKQELHIGQNIRLDNFELYDIQSNGDIIDVSEDSYLGLGKLDNETAVVVHKTRTDPVALNFPSYSNYVKNNGYDRNDDTKKSDFSLLIQNVSISGSASDTIPIKIKARGFDDKGAVPVYDNIQYGIWEQTQTANVDTTQTDTIRVNFTDCPSNVKYIDFLVILDEGDDIDVTMNKFMYYEGKDIDIKHDVDTSEEYANRVDIYFKESYFANLYDEDDNGGLCIIRPSQKVMSLRQIYADEETVLVPYMKNAREWDKPNQVFLEYLNSKRQTIDINWEN